MRITVFTPTYNRAYTIEKLYRSLQQQSFRDFEWIVVDDGSTDNTEELFSQYEKESNAFPIRYIKTENGGKHRAINRGVQEANGELFLIVDSDDYLTDDALAAVDKVEQSILPSEKSKFGGVCGLRGHENLEIIGQTFAGEYLDITMLERPQHGVFGDKSEAFYTEVLRRYPFPEFKGENFLTECVVWDRIASDGYLLRFYNQISIICNYLPDGLTSDGSNKYKKNPKGWGLYLYQSSKYAKITGVDKWNKYLEYYYAMRDSWRFREIADKLHHNPVKLWIGLLGIRLFYKIYDR